MGFFLQIHRSIFDSSFYGELAEIPRGRKIFYVVHLLIFASIVAGIAHTYYAMDTKRGIAAPIQEAFSGIEIIDGVLSAHCQIPYAVSPENVATLISRVDAPFAFELDAVPLVWVDTAYSPKKGDIYPRIILSAKEIMVYNSASWFFAIPYAEAFRGIHRFSFTVPFINNYLHRKILSLAANFLFLEGIQCGFLILSSIGILALAPFIFRIERSLTFFYFLSIACFAVTPVPVGFMLMAVSGTSFPVGGGLLFLISAVVMFRALKGMKTMTSKQNPEDRRP